ncbi:hypothetical protein [Kitasatospora sp. NPDC088548]|uniref:hypothetical protein n=1 Tax=Kitasatospora sp. NPDC088548 TaxID=3364075 RepID=UPI0038262C69
MQPSIRLRRRMPDEHGRPGRRIVEAPNAEHVHGPRLRGGRGRVTVDDWRHRCADPVGRLVAGHLGPEETRPPVRGGPGFHDSVVAVVEEVLARGRRVGPGRAARVRRRAAPAGARRG